MTSYFLTKAASQIPFSTIRNQHSKCRIKRIGLFEISFVPIPMRFEYYSCRSVVIINELRFEKADEALEKYIRLAV